MAKDLPYFKFFCSEWNDGDITLESYEVQRVFINICSYYWSKECNVTKKLLYKRFRNSKEIIDYLIKENLIKINNEHLSISFLNEQFSDVESTSKIKSVAGKKSAKLKKLRKEIDELCREFSIEFNVDLTKLKQEFNTDSTDVDFLLQHISTIKIRRDKIRRDNNKPSEVIFNHDNIDLFKQQLANNIEEHQQWIDSCYMSLGLRKNTISTLIDNYKNHLLGFNLETKKDMQDFKKHFRSWLLKEKRNNNLNDYLKR